MLPAHTIGTGSRKYSLPLECLLFFLPGHLHRLQSALQVFYPAKTQALEGSPPATSRTGTPSRQGPHQAAGRPLPPRGCRRDPHRASFMAARSLSSQAARCSRSSSSELVACALCRDSADWAPASLRAASSSFSSFTWGTGRAFRVEVGKRRHPVSGLGDSVLTQPLWAAGYPQWGLHDSACGPSSPVTRLVAWHGL